MTNPTSQRSGDIRRRCIDVVAGAFLVVCGMAASSLAEPPQPERPKVSGQIQYVGPDTYILLDAEGSPQPVLGMTYEEFVAAWKQTQNLAAAAIEPRYTVEELRIEGQAKQDHAELEVAVTVRMLGDAAVQIPLGMAGAILREQPRWEDENGDRVSDGGAAGDGDATVADADRRDETSAAESFIDFDPQRGGLVAGLHGRPGERRRVLFRMLVPLVRDGNETALRLNCPRALASRLVLDLPMPVADATATDGTLLTKETGEVGGTRLTAEGLAGDFRLAWRTDEPQRPELSTVLK